MDIAEHFEIVSLTKHVLHIEIKGFWSDQVVDEIGDLFLTRVKKAIDKISTRGRFILLVELSSPRSRLPESCNLVEENSASEISSFLIFSNSSRRRFMALSAFERSHPR